MATAKSFDELIDELLYRVALRGEQGATLNEFKQFLDDFYAAGDDDSDEADAVVSIVDRKLQEKAWDWFIVHPDIWVGKSREGNKLTLAQAETYHDGDPNIELRVYTTQDRVWQAVAGHGVDWQRIPPSQFQLLTMIAAAGKNGIIQSKLRDLSGQDKRSVPQRTDKLAQNGYIQKRPVYAKRYSNVGGAKTSLLIHAKYVKTDDEQEEEAKEKESGVDRIFVGSTVIMDAFINVILPLFDHAPDKIVAWDDICQQLGVKDNEWQRRWIWRCFERLHYLGVVARVLAKQTGHEQRSYVRCVQLRRQPTDQDREAFKNLRATSVLEWRQKENAKHAHGVKSSAAPYWKRKDKEPLTRTEEDEMQDAEGEPDEEFTTSNTTNATNENNETTSQRSTLAPDSDVIEDVEPLSDGDMGEMYDDDTEGVLRTVCQWTPEKTPQNFLYDLIKAFGSRGATTREITRSGMGIFWRRPLDQLLGKITDAWQKSQPKHLQHMAVIRDTTIMDNGRQWYLYRTYDNFVQAVEEGRTTWEAVQGSKEKKKAGVRSVSEEHQGYDEFGFPIQVPGKFVKRDGTGTLAEAVHASRIPQRELSSSDPRVQTMPDGTRTVVWPLKERHTYALTEGTAVPRSTPRPRRTPKPRRTSALVRSEATRQNTPTLLPSRLGETITQTSTPRTESTPGTPVAGAVFDASKRHVKRKAKKEIARVGRVPKLPEGAPKGATIAGLRFEKGNELYRTDPQKYRRLLSHRKEHAVQNRRQAERMALEEALIRKLISTIRIPAQNAQMDNPQPLVGFSNPPMDLNLFGNPAGLGVLASRLNMWQSKVEELAAVNNVTASQHRIQEIQKELENRNRMGVHVNPWDAREPLFPKEARKLPPKRLIITMKLDGLKRLDCFVKNPGITGWTHELLGPEAGTGKADELAEPAYLTQTALPVPAEMEVDEIEEVHLTAKLLSAANDTPMHGDEESSVLVLDESVVMDGIEAGALVDDNTGARSHVLTVTEAGLSLQDSHTVSAALLVKKSTTNDLVNAVRSLGDQNGIANIIAESLVDPMAVIPVNTVGPDAVEQTTPTEYGPENAATVPETRKLEARTDQSHDTFPHQQSVVYGSGDAISITTEDMEPVDTGVMVRAVTKGTPRNRLASVAGPQALQSAVELARIGSSAVALAMNGGQLEQTGFKPSRRGRKNGSGPVLKDASVGAYLNPPRSWYREGRCPKNRAVLVIKTHRLKELKHLGGGLHFDLSQCMPSNDSTEDEDAEFVTDVYPLAIESVSSLPQVVDHGRLSEPDTPAPLTTHDPVFVGAEQSSTDINSSKAIVHDRSASVPVANRQANTATAAFTSIRDLRGPQSVGMSTSQGDNDREREFLTEQTDVAFHSSTAQGNVNSHPSIVLNDGFHGNDHASAVHMTAAAVTPLPQTSTIPLAQPQNLDASRPLTTQPDRGIMQQQHPIMDMPEEMTALQLSLQAEESNTLDDDGDEYMDDTLDLDGSWNKKRSIARKKSGVTLGGGAVSQARTKIILKIMEMCGGVFSGKNEMIPVFQNLWAIQYPDAPRPDRQTANKAIQSLITDGRLHVVNFHFTDTRRISHVGTVIILSSIAPDSPSVAEMQRNIMKASPEFYHPPPVLLYIQTPDRTKQGPILPIRDDVTVKRKFQPDWMVKEERKRARIAEETRKAEEASKAYRGGRLQRVTKKRREVIDVEAEGQAVERRPSAPNIEEISSDEDGQIGGGKKKKKKKDQAFHFRPAGLTAEWVPPPGYKGPTAGSVSFKLPIQAPRAVQPSPAPAPPRKRRHKQISKKLDDVEEWMQSRQIKPPLTFSTLLVPQIQFHAATGTFSTFFSGLHPHTVPPPKSLQEILSSATAVSRPEDIEDANEEFEQFAKEISEVGSWEVAMMNAFPTGQMRDLHFINHELNVLHEKDKNSVRKTKPFAWERCYVYTKEKMELHADTATKPLWQPYKEREPAVNNKKRPAPATPSEPILEPPKKRRNRKKKNEKYQGALTTLEPATPATPLHLAEDGEEDADGITDDEVYVEEAEEDYEEEVPTKRRSTKKPHGNKGKMGWNSNANPDCHIDAQTTTKLMIAGIVARTLKGSVDLKPDFDVIARAFRGHPNWDRPTFRLRWTWIIRNHNDLVERLQAEFENKFLEAYARGDIPQFDFKKSKNYDWDGLIQWAFKALVLPSTDCGVLPTDRSTLTNNSVVAVDLERKPPNKMSLYRELEPHKNRKRVTHQLGFHVPLDGIDRKSLLSSDPTAREVVFTRVKSWVRANVATLEENYDAARAAAKLRLLPTDMVSEALKSFRDNSVFVTPPKNRIIPERNYRIHPKFFESLKQRIEPAHLHQAAQFKRKLDEAFAGFRKSTNMENHRVKLAYDADDGTILALTNLVAHGRVKAVPRLPEVNHEWSAPWPRLSKWGFEPGIYKTTSLDREYLFFEVDYEPTANYIFGNPLASMEWTDGHKTLPPLSPIDIESEQVLIPIWYDIHGNVLHDFWQRIAAAVLHIISQRPGVAVAELEEYFNKSVWQFELQMAVDQLAVFGAVVPMKKCGVKTGALPQLGGLTALVASGPVLGGGMDLDGPMGSENGSGRGGERWTLGEWWWMVLADYAT